MLFQQNVVILSASAYQFNDEKTKKEVSGCSVHYVISEDLAPTENEEKLTKGYKPAKANFPYEFYEKLQDVPALYTLDIEVKAGSDGKMVAVPTDFAFVVGLFA